MSNRYNFRHSKKPSHSHDDEKTDEVQTTMVNHLVDEVKKKVKTEEDLIREKAARVVYDVIHKAQQALKKMEKEKIRSTALSLVDQVIEEVEEDRSKSSNE